MPKLINLVGQSFGELTVVCRTGTRKLKGRNTQPLWLCQCICGRQKEIASVNLRNGNTKSCGKCNYAAERRWKKGRTWRWRHHLKPGIITRNAVLMGYKRGAKSRELEWEISGELFDQLTGSSCFYCGSSPINNTKITGDSARFIYNGIDRKDNKKGYQRENVVACCKICNRAKSDLNYEDWLTYLKRIKAHTM